MHACCGPLPVSTMPSTSWTCALPHAGLLYGVCRSSFAAVRMHLCGSRPCTNYIDATRELVAPMLFWGLHTLLYPVCETSDGRRVQVLMKLYRMQQGFLALSPGS